MNRLITRFTKFEPYLSCGELVPVAISFSTSFNYKGKRRDIVGYFQVKPLLEDETSFDDYNYIGHSCHY